MGIILTSESHFLSTQMARAASFLPLEYITDSCILLSGIFQSRNVEDEMSAEDCRQIAGKDER